MREPEAAVVTIRLRCPCCGDAVCLDVESAGYGDDGSDLDVICPCNGVAMFHVEEWQ
jgi:hypothetical protein